MNKMIMGSVNSSVTTAPATTLPALIVGSPNTPNNTSDARPASSGAMDARAPIANATRTRPVAKDGIQDEQHEEQDAGITPAVCSKAASWVRYAPAVISPSMACGSTASSLQGL
jgi:hypothetical protein